MKRVLLPDDSIRMECCEQVAALLLRRTGVRRLALTTPVFAGVPMTVPCTAEEAMSELNMPVNDLSSVAQAVPAEVYDGVVYVKPEGCQVLAEVAVCALEEYIGIK